MQFNPSRILLVVAHPDDEVLGPGGTMHRLIKENAVTVHVVILGEGITSRSDVRDTQQWSAELDIHRKNIHAARAAVGYQSVSLYDFPDNRFDSIPLLDIIKVVEKEKAAFQPDVIVTHHGGDVNIDHQKTFEAVITACRPIAHETVKTILTFETMSGTEWRASNDPRHFIPNMFFRISDTDLQAKINAMESYEYEKRPFPHPRSPKALRIRAMMWGVTVGVEFAEAFCLVRNIN
jgi:LmbE family N-acetylglucosaminyl deacetylase